MDYLRPYSLAHPVQSFTVLEQAPEPEYGYEDTFPTAEGTMLTAASKHDARNGIAATLYFCLSCFCALLLVYILFFRWTIRR